MILQDFQLFYLQDYIFDLLKLKKNNIQKIMVNLLKKKKKRGNKEIKIKKRLYFSIKCQKNYEIKSKKYIG